MSRKKLILIISGAALVAAAFLLPWFFWQRGNQDSNLITEKEYKYVHPLTGRGIDYEPNFFTIAVMIDNAFEVPFAFGLDSAHLVFEAPVEGGRTRFMALYDSKQTVEAVGPVRSVRPYFVDWALGYDPAIMHVGGSPDGLARVEESGVLNIDQIGADEIYFFRDNNLEAPHNVFTNTSLWLKAGERKNIEETSIEGWQFEKLQPTSLAEQQLTVTYSPDNVVAWVYNPDKNNYVRFLNGERYLTPLGNQVQSSNIIVMDVDIDDIDSIGRLSIDTVGSGEAVILTSGSRKEVSWIKNTEKSQVLFLDKETQQEVTLNIGNSWILAVPGLDRVEYITK